MLQPETRLAVLKGAVLMGFKPRNIVQRKARFTYGFQGVERFLEGKHPEFLKVVQNGEPFCGLIFKKAIEVGSILHYMDMVGWKGHNSVTDPALKNKNRYTALWRSSKPDPLYCLEEDGCEKVGKLVLKPPQNGWPDYWESYTYVVVGETEFTIRYHNLTSEEEYETDLEFL